MEISNAIYQKLEAFIRKYYWNELLRGIIFFIGLGLLYFLFTLFIEYFLWLQPLARTVLFWTFILVEVFLLLRLILFPLFKLFKLQKGLSYPEASILIGNHFANVKDTLTNFLQLSSKTASLEMSELLAASITQKANALQPIPFGNAIVLKANKKYLPLVAIPLVLFGLFYWSGNTALLSQSLHRVVHYNTAFLPPAPFEFVVVNRHLETQQNKDFVLKIKTVGKLVPEQVQIVMGSESYFLESTKTGEFQFKITNPNANVPFYLKANEVVSKDYLLQVLAVPSISDFEMQLQFPAYLHQKARSIQGTGNAVVPEGTQITWKIKTQATQSVTWFNGKQQIAFQKAPNGFILHKNIVQNTEYQISTSNAKLPNHEKLDYQLTVIPDQYPSIQVQPAPDSLQLGASYLLGQLADDYGISKLEVVYYPKAKPTLAQRATLKSSSKNVSQFVFAFPSNLSIKEGVVYDYYFEVSDNDALHNFKRSKSGVFSMAVLTTTEKQEQILEQQNQSIQNLENALNKQNKQISALDKLQKSGKENQNFDFKEQQKLSDFIQKQEKQDALMKQFSDKMKDNLEQFKPEKKEALKEGLLQRLEKASKDLEENKKLLDELKSINDKIQNEDLQSKLEKLEQNSKNQVKNLKQLVELTKKYYVEKKAEQIAEKLNTLSEKQEKLADQKESNTLEKQEKINTEFDTIKKELEALKKDNQNLVSPLALPNEALDNKKVDMDLQNATQELKKQNQDKAKPKQKDAAKKMQSMAKKMSESLQENADKEMEEDVKMLRQILDNLVAFSLSQEELLNQFKSSKSSSATISKKIKWQQNLKEQFQHLDDSLYAMSLRNPTIAEDVTKQIGNMQYNIDNSLERFTDMQFAKGISHQQYTIAAANKLGDFLSNYLSVMQLSLSQPGSGKPKPGDGDAMQLPDIIKRQEGLGQKIKSAIESGKDPGDKNPGNSKGSKDGEGKDGEGDAKEILEIYKEQQLLREALDRELKKQGFSMGGQNALEQMKQLEKQLLNKGLTPDNLQKILRIQRELLQLDTAIKEQGEDPKRQSEISKNQFSANAKPLPKALLDYLNSIEILNRQSLPLRSNFNHKVQEYFNKK
ncbi:DUF4175 family protein [Flavobacterium crassostreae]|uniref:Glutamyl-tRNA synthetase n=1 Tax=Flavobacterium crassostreae TaxID=1763534 RepID=A0A1B9E650_9FLAO|nr:DUF4175 family protein [Flavobacterium crassostreae]OCB77401.1 hypothetical protein LPBF_04080 [Flavobacterium crassostreae]